MPFQKKYSLPKFPPNCIATFRMVSKALPEGEIPGVREKLEVAVGEMLKECGRNRLLSASLVEQLADRCRFLLDNYSNFKRSQRALAIGAVFYFAMDCDSGSDSSFATGLDDDCAVMNYVLQELDIEDKFIEVTP